MTDSYSVQNSEAKPTLIFFLRNMFLLDYDHSLANSLFHYELKYLVWCVVLMVRSGVDNINLSMRID